MVIVATTPQGATAMSKRDLFELDRSGYLLIKGLLTPPESAQLAAAVDRLESDAHARLADGAGPVPPSTFFAQRGYHALVNAGRGADGPGRFTSVVLEDWWNADSAFDLLVDHAPTMAYMSSLIQEEPRLNNSQLFLRYPGSTSQLHSGTWSHGGGSKYRYSWRDGKPDCMLVRLIYFPVAVTADMGAFTVVPGTHKSNAAPPGVCEAEGGVPPHPSDQPGSVVLETEAGDAILFVEALCHGEYAPSRGYP
jgi:hypothetical protein